MAYRVSANEACAQVEENEEPSFVVPYSQQLDYSSAPKADSLSPLWKELPDICTLCPLPDLSQGLCISSASSRTRHPITNFFIDVKYLLPSDSLHYHSPPSALRYNLTDEISETFKDTHSTIKSLKAISPNQKRVSAPQQLIHEVSSSYTPGLKRACKNLQFSSHSKTEEKSGK